MAAEADELENYWLKLQEISRRTVVFCTSCWMNSLVMGWMRLTK